MVMLITLQRFGAAFSFEINLYRNLCRKFEINLYRKVSRDT